MCSVYVTEQDKVINIASEHLEPIPPEVGDKVWYFLVKICIHYSLNQNTKIKLQQEPIHIKWAFHPTY